jgi:branched-chain amino acid transport system permease protein
LDLNRSFQILFIIIIGGLGSLAGSFYGAAFIVLLPIAAQCFGTSVIRASDRSSTFTKSAKNYFRGIDHLFLIKEPEGISRFLRNVYQRLRTWPLRY